MNTEEGVLRAAMEAAPALRARDERPGVIGEAEKLVTTLHAGAVNTFLDANGIDRATHRRRRLPRPDHPAPAEGEAHGADRRRRRAGAPSSRLPVVYDFRAADVAAGGQGAPLVPVYHRALARKLDEPHPIAVLNLGGVANITFIDGENDPIACDTGPANALIDDFMRARSGATRDEDGRAAAAGRVDEAAIARLLDASVLRAPAPKSLDRNDFRGWVAEHAGLAQKSTEDGAATLTALTAASVARVIAQSAARAAKLDRGRRRRAQSDADAHAGRASCIRRRSKPPARSAGRPMRWRRRPSLFWRCDR